KAASPNEECMIFDFMQAADGEQDHGASGRLPACHGTCGNIDSKMVDEQLVCRRSILLQQFAAIVFGNGYAEEAVLDLGIQIRFVNQQVGPGSVMLEPMPSTRAATIPNQDEK